MARTEPTVFVNYRSSDEPWAAVAVNNELSCRFGDSAVFIDAKSMVPGRDFDKTLLAAVRRSVVLLAIVGRRWLTESDGHGRRLVDQPADWVRREIVEAFRSSVPVIPVLIGEISRLEASALPPALRRLARCPYVRLRHRDFKSDLDRLVTYVSAIEPRLAVAPANDAVA